MIQAAAGLVEELVISASEHILTAVTQPAAKPLASHVSILSDLSSAWQAYWGHASTSDAGMLKYILLVLVFPQIMHEAVCKLSARLHQHTLLWNRHVRVDTGLLLPICPLLLLDHASTRLPMYIGKEYNEGSGMVASRFPVGDCQINASCIAHCSQPCIRHLQCRTLL